MSVVNFKHSPCCCKAKFESHIAHKFLTYKNEATCIYDINEFIDKTHVIIDLHFPLNNCTKSNTCKLRESFVSLMNT